ncbi:hypothetical protein [Xanthomonas arboricola]|uniref:hypothetical protein n=1 Tax=Xanthomonas arboricola TaxID=56448 RepID=UPI001586B431|nr:hypothetical protein [Xanthomonas arboricola]MDN0272175.1 hypothetical protein [Xanthomonas arboricola pv. pruni]MDN0300703.1 hypothetical protein [Xanthomonas arboricola pv. pruni]UJO08978.1 hypothetical protein K9U02_02725 [Xanthomonas arboricola pv. pruni]UQQ08894.1 hypothetical protein KP026_05470 [Xanthomonas arboricola pv. pruni]
MLNHHVLAPFLQAHRGIAADAPGLDVWQICIVVSLVAIGPLQSNALIRAYPLWVIFNSLKQC